jgi:hypothetical protein
VKGGGMREKALFILRGLIVILLLFYMFLAFLLTAIDLKPAVRRLDTLEVFHPVRPIQTPGPIANRNLEEGTDHGHIQ